MGDMTDGVGLMFKMYLLIFLVWGTILGGVGYGVVKLFHWHPVDRAKEMVCRR